MRLHLIKVIGTTFIMITLFSMVFDYSLVVNAITGNEQGKVDFIDNSEDEVEENTQKALDSVSDSIIGIARVVSYTIAMVTLMTLGIRYMVSAPGDRAEIKKHAVIYFVGAFILFALPTIIEILIKLSETFSK